MNKKLLIVPLLVIVLFGVSLVLGVREPGSGLKFDPQSPNLARIASWLSRPAKPENLTLDPDSPAGCGFENNQISIQPGATCVFNVSSDKVWTRKLRLMLLPPQDGPFEIVNITLEQPDVLPVEQTLEPGKTSEPLDIYGRKDQADATLTIKAPPGTGLESWVVYVIEVIAK